MLGARILLIDVSNTFTKAALATLEKVGKVHRFRTSELRGPELRKMAGRTPLRAVVLCSVVPERTRLLRRCFEGVPIFEVGPDAPLGVGIDYPDPASIGPDRLANAAAAQAFYGAPSIVIDFGTAVTFDVISREKGYLGGVIAPGLNAMTDYLHDRTALLPKIRLREPVAAIGRSTQDAMIAGAVYGYRGLIRGILGEIRRAAFAGKRCPVVATGGDAELIATGMPEIQEVHPTLTLEGLRIIAQRWLE